jgi:hypothetical protein
MSQRANISTGLETVNLVPLLLVFEEILVCHVLMAD